MREWDRAGNRRVRVRAARPDAETLRLERQRQRQRGRITPITSLSKPPRALPKYRTVIVDKAGRRGVFVDFLYDSAARNRFGVAKRRVEYMFKDDHTELIDGQVPFRSNLGESYHEIIAAVDVAETANRSARKNAKVGTNAIYQFAADLDQAARLRAMDMLAAKYDSLGLPYVMVPHVPSPGSDERNFHVHAWFTTRPMERVGHYEWAIGQQLRTDCDGADALYDLRRTWAEICTKVSHERGQRYRYTHLGNAERGLSHRPQQRLDPRQVENWRKGKYEESVASMQETITENENLVAEIEERNDQGHSRKTRAGLPDLDNPEVTRAGLRLEPARAVGRGEEFRDVPVAGRQPSSSPGQTISPIEQAIPDTDTATAVVPAPIQAHSPVPAGNPAIASRMSLAGEKLPQLRPSVSITSATHLVPTPPPSIFKRVAPSPSFVAHLRLSTVTPPAMPSALSPSLSEQPRRLTTALKQRHSRTLEAAQPTVAARLTPVTLPRPITLTPVAPAPAPSPLRLTPLPKRIVPHVLKAPDQVTTTRLEPVSSRTMVLLISTAPTSARPRLIETSTREIPPLQASASASGPQLHPVGGTAIPMLTATERDPDHARRETFARRLWFERLSFALTVQGLQLTMVGERLAHARAATDDEHALLDRASLEFFAVNPAVARHARDTIDRFVALYMERENRSDPFALATAPSVRSIDTMLPVREQDAALNLAEVRPPEAKGIAPPGGASDTSGSGGSMAISLSGSPDFERTGNDKVEYIDWRFSDRPVDPLERVQWLFAYMRQNGRKRLVRIHGQKFMLPPDLLKQLELSEADLAGDAVQARLRTEHDEQVDGLVPLANHLAARPDLMVRSTRHWFILGGPRRDKAPELAEELSRWRNEPLVHSALDNFDGLPPTPQESDEWQRRMIAFVGTVFPNEPTTPPPTHEATGASEAEQQNTRADVGCQKADEGTSQNAPTKDQRDFGPPPNTEGIGG
ncbi:MAG: hypothetical protein K5799_05125 [Erythrobacter sp.]|nr:hypothetical protein [Erythrobacter sp.]